MEDCRDAHGKWCFGATWWVSTKRLRPFSRVELAREDGRQHLSMVFDYVQASGGPGEREVTFLDDENTLEVTLQERAGTCTARLRTGSGSAGADAIAAIPLAILDEVYAFYADSHRSQPGAPPCDWGQEGDWEQSDGQEPNDG